MFIDNLNVTFVIFQCDVLLFSPPAYANHLMCYVYNIYSNSHAKIKQIPIVI